MKKIKTILIKEWMEVFKNKMVIFTVAFLPLMMVTIPLAMFTVHGDQRALSPPDKPPGNYPTQYPNRCAHPALQGQNASRCTWSASS